MKLTYPFRGLDRSQRAVWFVALADAIIYAVVGWKYFNHGDRLLGAILLIGAAWLVGVVADSFRLRGTWYRSL